MRIFNLFELEKEIQVMDIGQLQLLKFQFIRSYGKMMAHLTVFDGDVADRENRKHLWQR